MPDTPDEIDRDTEQRLLRDEEIEELLEDYFWAFGEDALRAKVDEIIAKQVR